ncbi:MAG: M23 family metallopeptidase [Microthrixaceae bacterium]
MGRLVALGLTLTLLGGPAPLPGVGAGPHRATQAAPRPPGVAPDGSRPRFAPPVDAPIADPFRAPSGPYGPGNRGIEYATAPGTPVRAIGAGTVAFAGVVAGRGVVSVDHPSGLRSTYTGLASRAVGAGEAVALGQVVGTTAAHLHLGLRDGRTYLDPAAFFGAAPAVLVPDP